MGRDSRKGIPALRFGDVGNATIAPKHARLSWRAAGDGDHGTAKVFRMCSVRHEGGVAVAQREVLRAVPIGGGAAASAAAEEEKLEFRACITLEIVL